VRGWEVLIIPAIAVIVWILATIFRGANDSQKAPPRRFPDRYGDVPPQRRPMTRVARAPEEVRRPEPSQRRFTPPRPETRRPVVLEEMREPLRAQPVPRPAQKPVVLELAEPETAPSPRLEEARAEFKRTESPSQPPAPAMKPAVVSPTLLQVRQMLRSPQSAAAALVLREILDAPRCRRPK
jgi:hypothetical protein